MGAGASRGDGGGGRGCCEKVAASLIAVVSIWLLVDNDVSIVFKSSGCWGPLAIRCQTVPLILWILIENIDKCWLPVLHEYCRDTIRV